MPEMTIPDRKTPDKTMSRTRTLRRSARSVIAATLVAALVACSGPQPPKNPAIAIPDALYRGDAGRSGSFDVPAVRDVKLAWRVKEGDGFNSSPVVAGDTVFVGGYGGSMYAYETRKGTKRWAFRAGKEVLGEPSVRNGLVVFGSDDGHVYALDAKTGEQRWRLKTGGGVDQATLTNQDLIYAVSRDGNVYALALTDGKERWRYSTGGQFRSAPAILGNAVLAGTSDGRVFALEADTGKKRLEMRVPDSVYGIAATPEVVIVASTFVVDRQENGEPQPRATLTAFDPRTGGRRWQKRIDFTQMYQPPAVANGLVLAGFGFSQSGWLSAYDIRDGKERWTWKGGGREVRSAPAVSGNVVYIADGYPSNVYGVDLKTGRELWVIGAEDAVWTAPAPANGWLYVVDGGLIGYRGVSPR
jgi:eukaryotic-like serine/threonine-protein kinase